MASADARPAAECETCGDEGGWTVVEYDPVRGGAYTRDRWVDCPDCEARLVAEDERAHIRRKEDWYD